MTVAESLAAATPAIVTSGAPWMGLEEKNAGWWIDIGKEPLVTCLHSAMSKSRDELDQMGSNGCKWMEDGFSWSQIAWNMKQTYGWLLNRNEKPECVAAD